MKKRDWFLLAIPTLLIALAIVQGCARRGELEITGPGFHIHDKSTETDADVINAARRVTPKPASTDSNAPPATFK